MNPGSDKKNFKTSSERIFGLDLFRAIAILSVVFGHCSVLLQNTAPGFPNIILPNGVDMFFALSGFLIGGILIRTMEAEEKIDGRTLFNFWIRRWLRTLPLYYLFLIINIVLLKYEWMSGDLQQFNYKFFFFLQNFCSGYYGFFWESWTLAVEEWFYILFPFVLIFLLKIFSSVKRRWIFLSAGLLFLLFPTLVRIFNESSMPTDSFWFGVEVNKVVIYRFDALMYGVLAAYLMHYHETLWKKSRYFSLLAGIIIIWFLESNAKDVSEWFYRTVVYNISGVAMLLLLPVFSYWYFDRMNSWDLKMKAVFTWLSKISYSMYLLNLLLILVIEKNFMPLSPSIEIPVYILYWIVLIGLSSVLYMFFEKPFMGLREKFKI